MKIQNDSIYNEQRQTEKQILLTIKTETERQTRGNTIDRHTDSINYEYIEAER